LFLLGRILRRLRVGRRWLSGGCGRGQKIKEHRTLPSNRARDLSVKYSLSQSFVDSFRRRDGEASGPWTGSRVGAEALHLAGKNLVADGGGLAAAAPSENSC